MKTIRQRHRLMAMSHLACIVVLLASCSSQTTVLKSSPFDINQPKVNPGPEEPNWWALLEQQWGLDLDRDLRNPRIEGVEPAGLFQKADKSKPVVFTPIIALGMEATTHGGWYTSSEQTSTIPIARTELWSYAYKQPSREMKACRFTAPPLKSGKAEFDPADKPFGLWVSNDHFNDEGVFTQPSRTAKANARLKDQPYKAMIYPNRDIKTGELIPDSYIIGWEYSTNDDFQDVVTRIDNVRLLPANPPLIGMLPRNVVIKKLAGDFKFVEGPAWDFKNKTLYFSDIPQNQIIRYVDGLTNVSNANSGMSNGLMFDKQGSLIACEHANRRVSRTAVPGEKPAVLATHYMGKKLNSPNDLWIDAQGGIYFTDPRYGSRKNMEQDKEAVYYLAADGQLTRIIDDLVRPNGIALSPDGQSLYVVDHGGKSLHRYPITAPGKVGQGKRIAHLLHPDGMTIDAEGRLWVTADHGICVLEPNGKWIGRIHVPEWPANCTFGGPGNRTLFITARSSLYSIETLTRGWHVHLDGVPAKKSK